MPKYKTQAVDRNVLTYEYELQADGTWRETTTGVILSLVENLADTRELAQAEFKYRLQQQIQKLQQEIETQTDRPVLARAKKLLDMYKNLLARADLYSDL